MATHNLENTAWMLQGRVGYGRPVLVALVIPTALITVGTRFGVVAGEEAAQIFRIYIVLADKGRGVSIMQNIVIEIGVVFQQVVNDSSQEDNIAASACWHIEIRQRG